jgi:ubiquinone/menaquinone biosynthesis C-methylase UbiE
MGLKQSYTLLAPFYDLLVATGPLDNARAASLSRLESMQGGQVLISGIGTGLDIPYLPAGPAYTGTDITPAMLDRAHARAGRHDVDIELRSADSQNLPFDDSRFDAVIMHLILAVVPCPADALREAERVLKHGGRIYILDKFLRPGQRAPVRRAINLLLRHIATRTDVVFEEAMSQCRSLQVVDDRPALAGGWFRLIELRKDNTA